MSDIDPDLERELTDLANTPLSLEEIERLEIAAVDTLMHSTETHKPVSRRILQMTAEIRRHRGDWNTQKLTQREIDDEIAMNRGAS